MTSPSIIPNTFTLERALPHPPEAVFAALSNPAIKRLWFAEGHSHDVETYDLDFRTGGLEHAVYRFREGTPFPGVELASTGFIHDIVPNRRLVMSATMTIGGRPISVALATFELLPTATGTDLLFTHQAVFFEGADGPDMRKDGWVKLFDKLEKELAN